MLVETLLSADLRVSDIGVPVPPPVADGVPFLHASLMASSSKPIADRQGVAPLLPDEVDTEQSNTEEEGEEDEIIGRIVTSIVVVCRFGFGFFTRKLPSDKQAR